jgi:hypothetical protein
MPGLICTRERCSQMSCVPEFGFVAAISDLITTVSRPLAAGGSRAPPALRGPRQEAAGLPVRVRPLLYSCGFGQIRTVPIKGYPAKNSKARWVMQRYVNAGPHIERAQDSFALARSTTVAGQAVNIARTINLTRGVFPFWHRPYNLGFGLTALSSNGSSIPVQGGWSILQTGAFRDT